MELHLELVARELYAEAFFGGKVSDGLKELTRKRLLKGVQGFSRLVKFSPHVAGTEFTLADCAAVTHLPLVSSASKLIYGEDVLAGLPIRDYLKAMGARPHVQTVNADRKTSTELMLSRLATKKA
jgi:glutathione S-transferase